MEVKYETEDARNVDRRVPRDLVKEQQAPDVNATGPDVWPLVIEDMKRRNEDGTKKYGTPLRPFNGRDPLTDAYQESLDKTVYLRQAIIERDALEQRLNDTARALAEAREQRNWEWEARVLREQMEAWMIHLGGTPKGKTREQIVDYVGTRILHLTTTTGTVRVSLEDLNKLIAENKHLKEQVTSLQENNTHHVMQLRKAKKWVSGNVPAMNYDVFLDHLSGCLEEGK